MITQQDDQLIMVGARINDPQLRDTDPDQMWIRFTLNSENAAILAHKLLSVVERRKA